MFKIDRALLVYFKRAMRTNDFGAHSTISRLHEKQCVKWTMSSNIVPEKENYRCDESQEKRTFKASEPNNVYNLRWSQSSGNKHGTTLAGTASIPRCCDRWRKRSSLSTITLSSSPRWQICRGSSPQGLVSAHYYKLCTSRRSCYIGHHNLIHSRSSRAPPQFSNPSKRL